MLTSTLGPFYATRKKNGKEKEIEKTHRKSDETAKFKNTRDKHDLKREEYKQIKEGKKPNRN